MCVVSFGVGFTRQLDPPWYHTVASPSWPPRYHLPVIFFVWWRNHLIAEAIPLRDDPPPTLGKIACVQTQRSPHNVESASKRYFCGWIKPWFHSHPPNTTSERKYTKQHNVGIGSGFRACVSCVLPHSLMPNAMPSCTRQRLRRLLKPQLGIRFPVPE